MRPTVFLLFLSLFMPGVGQAQSAGGGGNGAASELSEIAPEAEPQMGSDPTTQTVRYIAPAVAMDTPPSDPGHGGGSSGGGTPVPAPPVAIIFGLAAGAMLVRRKLG